MSELMREPIGSEPEIEAVLDAALTQRRADLARRVHHARSAVAPSLKVVTAEADLDEETIVLPADTLVAPSEAERAAYLAAVELRLRELVEIERMRDLEIHRLEAEVELQSTRILELETALFHSERRGDDLDRRWNDLAALYEENAAALIEAGATLEQIHEQASYKFVLALGRSLRKMPVIYAWLRRVFSVLLSPRID